MRHTLHLRNEVSERLGQLARQMHAWQKKPQLKEKEVERISDSIRYFNHTTKPRGFTLAGIDGTGDYPCLTYEDSFVYVTVAQGAVYSTDSRFGLKEAPQSFLPPPEFTWMPGDDVQARQEWMMAFERLTGMNTLDVIQQSDYRSLKSHASGTNSSISRLQRDLICPHASDSANIGVQLRTTAEIGLALQIIKSPLNLNYVLVDTTFSLPLVTRKDASLFYEHLKWLCCVKALEKGVGFFALSKSHGLASIEVLENLVKAKSPYPVHNRPEHWYLRLPIKGIDDWGFSLAEGRSLPPEGAVTYLFRFHANTPVMRLDMDVEYWKKVIGSKNLPEGIEVEKTIFEDLDFSSHDQRSFGYPYPLKSGHDRASLTQAERVSFKKQVISAAIAAGMNPSAFRDASLATGHK